ncbi:AAA family ATPase, partial [Deinococcus aerophilus]|uniref:AAA family ATPase n=1 Tax=Deinococcus aerophilus TaxID=522488 RepID=UPI00166C8042
MLIVFSGLPGTGKSTLARSIAYRLHAAYLRVDSVEAALLHAGMPKVTVEGYAAIYALEPVLEMKRLSQTVFSYCDQPAEQETG